MADYKRVPIDSISESPGLQPKIDENLIGLMQSAYEGRTPVYFGAIPAAIIVPFDIDYRPDLHPIGKQVISTYYEERKQVHLHHLLVSPLGICFIVSDHYISLFAALKGRAEYLPCWILGESENTFVKDLQGPIAQDDIPKILGWE